MSRQRWLCKMIGGEFCMIPIDEAEPTVRTQILTDTIEPTWHPATGQYCSSRTGMVKIAKQHGLDELGNERIKKRETYDRSELKRDILRAYDQVNNGR